MAMIRLVMLTHAENLNPGEVGGFDPPAAARLIAQGKARKWEQPAVTAEVKAAVEKSEPAPVPVGGDKPKLPPKPEELVSNPGFGFGKKGRR